VLIATFFNHALASLAGAWVSSLIEPAVLTWILAITFFVFGLWILIPDKEEEVKQVGHFGVLLTTVIAFFFAEMGDKTQLATIALGANYSNVVLVTLGTTLGMMGSNALAIFLGQKFLNRVPMLWVRRIACLIFIIFGIAILFRL
jgi:putative Ca2+/H+ antiporter (TMEM165/GDT1 family)